MPSKSYYFLCAKTPAHTYPLVALSPSNLCPDITNANPTNGNPTLSVDFLLGLALLKQIRAFSGRRAYLCFDVDRTRPAADSTRQESRATVSTFAFACTMTNRKEWES